MQSVQKIGSEETTSENKIMLRTDEKCIEFFEHEPNHIQHTSVSLCNFLFSLFHRGTHVLHGLW